jgi:hypothetical protein
MITILTYFLLIISVIVAITGMIYSYIKSKPIYFGTEVSIKKIIINSIIVGISASALMFAIIMIAGIMDPSNPVTYQNLFPSFTVAIVFGIVCILISFWSIFITRKYRNWLIKKILKK